MSVFPSIALAILIALAALAFALRAAVPARPAEDALQSGEPVPLAPLQRVSWWTLAAGLAFAVAATVVIAGKGVETWWTVDAVRLPVTGLMLAALLASLAPMTLARRNAASRGVLVDERDLEILRRAPSVQGAATLVRLALWTVVLMESFHAAGSVPVPFLVLVNWSCLVVYALALPVGILIGYWRR